MTDIRRTLLWVVFTMSLVLLWDGWQKHNGHPSMFSPAPAKTVAASGSNNGSTPPVVQPGATPAAAASAASAASGVAAGPAVAEQVTIKTDVLTVTLDSRGGDVTRVELPKILAAENHGLFDPLLRSMGLAKAPEHAPAPVVLIDPAHAYKAQSGVIGVAGQASPTHETVMTLVPGERELKDGANELVVRFESPEVGGLKRVLSYTFKRGDYLVGVKNEVVNVGANAVTPQLYLQLVRDAAPAPGASGFYSTFTGPAVYSDKLKFHKVDFTDIDKNKLDFEKKAGEGWVAMVQHYFTTAWLHNEAAPREFSVYKVQGGAAHQYAVSMVFTLPQLATGASATHQDQLYVGPQEENKLAALAPGLELVKDYGIFAVISKPLFWLLDNLHGFLKNWGWAIIALVVLLKIVFYPLNASAYRSMAKMKAINPKVQALRERYKDKPQEMQQEMMRIYREEKVNPLGGCLPVFLQMPVFIGLYWVLLSSVEMRGAPWLGWIQDLSVPDPYFILPILMTLSSLFQVWLNPKAPDPMQQRMMWIMPLAFSFMFFAFPAGLTLYYVVNNVLSIAQQWMINKQLGVQD